MRIARTEGEFMNFFYDLKLTGLKLVVDPKVRVDSNGIYRLFVSPPSRIPGIEKLI
jgi:hypothetical protein